MAVIEQKALHVNNRMERGLLFTVARDATEWESLGLGEQAPDIDWETRLAVVAVLGTRPSGGYRIEVAHAETAPGQVLVTVQEYAPGPHAIVSRGFTCPACVAVVPKLPDSRWTFLVPAPILH